MWEYGKLDGKIARRHRLGGNVQFVMWSEGHMVNGFTYPEDWWLNYDSSHWNRFQKYPDFNFDQI